MVKRRREISNIYAISATVVGARLQNGLRTDTKQNKTNPSRHFPTYKTHMTPGCCTCRMSAPSRQTSTTACDVGTVTMPPSVPLCQDAPDCLHPPPPQPPTAATHTHTPTYARTHAHTHTHAHTRSHPTGQGDTADDPLWRPSMASEGRSPRWPMIHALRTVRGHLNP